MDVNVMVVGNASAVMQTLIRAPGEAVVQQVIQNRGVVFPPASRRPTGRRSPRSSAWSIRTFVQLSLLMRP